MRSAVVTFTNRSGENSSMKTTQILIVDDDRDFANSIADILTEEGYETSIAYSGPEALEKIKHQKIDMVFLDVRMTDMDGIETVKELRKLKSDIRVAMMTGYSDQHLFREAMNNGAVSVLHKPINIEKLIATIRNARLDNLVLLVDDDPDFTDSLSAALEEKGHRVVVANTGEEALSYSLNDDIKLLILDFRLPGISGLEVYNNLKKQGMDLPTIVITAYEFEEKEQIDTLKSMSVSNIFRKPFHPEDLIQAIEALTTT